MNNLQINTINNNVKPLVRTSVHTSFKGENFPLQQHDIVEISSKEKKKRNNNLGIKLLLGGLAIGASIFAWIKLHKPEKAQEVFKSEFKNIESIRKNLSEIFEKDFTEKEADELAKRYKKICGIKDDNEFVEKLFEQLKTDYGFKNSHLKLEFKDFTSENAPNWGAMQTDFGHKIIVSRINGKLRDKEFLFDAMFHEFKHQKQFETAIATDTFNYEMAVAYRQMNIQHLTEQEINSFGGKMAILSSLKDQARPIMQPEIDRIKREIGQLPESSPLYQRGLEYIYATKNYPVVSEIPKNEEEYFNNILEKEAHRVGKLAREIFGFLK